MSDSYSFLGKELESPLINAEGSINGTVKEEILNRFEILANSAIGAITFGSITIPVQTGNEAKFGGPVYYHDKEKGETYNAIGVPNISLKDAILLMPELLAIAHERGKPVMVSMSPTLATSEIGDSFQQTKVLVHEFLNTGVDGIIINTSCPNIVTSDGQRKPMLGYDLEGMQRLAFELVPIIGTDRRVGLKLPPYMADEDKKKVPVLANLLKSQDIFSFIVTSNTIPNQIARDEKGNAILSVPGGAGGMSGPATRELGRDQLKMWVDELKGEKDIISTLGIGNGRELARRIELGANLGGGVTFLWESSNWGKAVSKMLEEFIAYEG